MQSKKVGFTSGLGFIMAAAGSAIGFITMLTEIYIGRRAQANPVTAFKSIHKNIGWMGVVAVVIPAFITCYYSVLGGWTLKFTLHSFQGNAGIIENFSTNTFEVIAFTALFVFLALAVIAAGVQSGIERMSKVLMPVLFVILVGVVIYSLTLGSGVREGLLFYLNPDFSGLTFSSVLSAMGQAFYSLSLGMGIIVTYGSYTNRETDLVRATAMICIFDTVVALLAGLAIFPAVAHFNPSLLDGSQGVALMYIILPEVFDSMGTAGKFVSFFFFAMVSIAALTSIMSLYEVCTQFVLQKFRFNRKRSTAVIGVLCLIVSIPIGISLGRVAILGEGSPALFGLDWLTFFDEVTNTVLMPVCAFFGCLAVGWIIRPERALNDLRDFGTNVPGWLPPVYTTFVKFVTPALILVIEIGGVRNEFGRGNGAVVYFALLLLLLSIALYFAFFRNTYTGTNADEKPK